MGRVLFTLGLFVVLGLGAATSSASGAVAGLETRTNTSLASGSFNRSVTASCPSGRRLLGAGGDTFGAEGQIVLDDLTPSSTLDGTTVFGAEDGNGTSTNWGLTAQAICATPLPGLELVSAPSPTDSSAKGVTATCPAGKRVVGAGADLTGGFGQVEIDDLVPNAGLTSVNAFAVEDGNGYSGSWSIRAHAICANPVAGLERRALASNSTSANKGVTAPCPGGKGALGGGWELLGGGGQVLVTRSLPGIQPSGGEVKGAEDEDGTTASWSVTAYSICANVSGLVSVSDIPGTASPRTVPAICPDGRQLTGMGADITGGFGQVLLGGLAPTVSLNSGNATARQDGNGASSNWNLTAYGICATPLPGLERVSATTATNSTTTKSAIATCPGTKRVVGAAGELDGGLGQATMTEVGPGVTLASVLVRGAEDDDGTTATWNVTAHAICADPPPGLQLVSTESEPDSQELKVVSADCPTGKNLLGTGTELDGAAGEVILDDLRPNEALTRTTVTAIEDEDGSVSDWSATAHAICANP